MIRTVPLWPMDQLRAEAKASRRAVVWASPSVASRVVERLGLPLTDPGAPLPAGCDLFIAVGGGTLLDRAKWTAKGEGRTVRLVAIPSLWGSGAEASKVVVLDDRERKTIHVGDTLLPDARVIWPELAETVATGRAVEACGDAWSHALEGFCSPLATEELRADLARLMSTMLELPLGRDPRWFELSAQACAGQAQSSVGLVHGIAHTLEHPLRSSDSGRGWGHAKLCSVFLWPVLTFNMNAMEKVGSLAKSHGLDLERVVAVTKKLHDPAAYAAALPTLTEHWKSVLRDVCTRTNCVLVRPGSLEFLQQWPGSAERAGGVGGAGGTGGRS